MTIILLNKITETETKQTNKYETEQICYHCINTHLLDLKLKFFDEKVVFEWNS